MTGIKSEKIRKEAVRESLDRTDYDLLEVLAENARLSNKELAARVGIAASTCHDRVRRLEACGVLRGARAVLDLEALGVSLQAMVAIRLNRHAEPLVLSFRDHMVALPEVLACFHMAGKSDFVLHVAVRDATHLRQLILREMTSRSEVALVETALVFEHAVGGALPIVR